MRKGHIIEVKISFTGLIPTAKITICSWNKYGMYEDFFYYLNYEKEENINKVDRIIEFMRERKLIYFEEPKFGKNIEKIFVEV